VSHIGLHHTTSSSVNNIIGASLMLVGFHIPPTNNSSPCEHSWMLDNPYWYTISPVHHMPLTNSFIPCGCQHCNFLQLHRDQYNLFIFGSPLATTKAYPKLLNIIMTILSVGVEVICSAEHIQIQIQEGGNLM